MLVCPFPWRSIQRETLVSVLLRRGGEFFFQEFRLPRVMTG
jgi:hypothetical protein